MSAGPDNSGRFRIPLAALSDIGRLRTRNEDAVAVCAEDGWAVLADGMGGYHGGDVAARIAISAVTKRLEYEVHAGRTATVDDAIEALASAVEDANAEIYRAGVAQPELAGMGATLVTALFLRGHVLSAHVGDSRLYRLQNGVFEQLTRDHTMLQEQVDGGMMSMEDARRSRYRGMLTRGLGVTVFVEPELGVHVARSGDIFLLCSDGLTDMVEDGEIARVLGAGDRSDVTARLLVDLANERGGRDNVSVIVAGPVS